MGLGPTITPPPDPVAVEADDVHHGHVVPFPTRRRHRRDETIDLGTAREAEVDAQLVSSQALARWEPTTIARRSDAVVIEEVPRPAHKFPPLGDCRLGRILTEHLVVDDTLDPRLAPISEPRGPVTEAYRSLFFRLCATSDAHSIMVAPASAEQDASVCAANLALTMAMASGGEVLLIETSFASPGLANLFGYRPSDCFGRRLARHRRAPDAPWRIAKLGNSSLNLLTVDPQAAVPPAMDARALAEVINSFRSGGFRHIVVAAPPLTKNSDARFVAKCVDGAVITIHAGDTRERDLKRSLDQLAPTPCLGTVFIEADD